MVEPNTAEYQRRQQQPLMKRISELLKELPVPDARFIYIAGCDDYLSVAFEDADHKAFWATHGTADQVVADTRKWIESR